MVLKISEIKQQYVSAHTNPGKRTICRIPENIKNKIFVHLELLKFKFAAFLHP